MPDSPDPDTLEILDTDPTTIEIVAEPVDLIEIHDNPPTTIDITVETVALIEVIETGPQGPPGIGVAAEQVSEQVAELVADFLHTTPAQVYVFTEPVSSWPMPHSFGRIPAVTLYSLTGRRIHTDVYATATTATALFPMPVPGMAVLT